MREEARALFETMSGLGFTQKHGAYVCEAMQCFVRDARRPEQSIASLTRTDAGRRKRRVALARHLRAIAALMEEDGAGLTFDLALSDETEEVAELLQKASNIQQLADALEKKNMIDGAHKRSELGARVRHLFWSKLAVVFEDARPGERASLYNDLDGEPRGKFLDFVRCVYAVIGSEPPPSPHTLKEWCRDIWPENRGGEQMIFALHTPFDSDQSPA